LRIGLYDRTSEGLLRREQLELDVSGASTDVPGLVGKQQPDFILINDDDLAYAKIRLDERSLRTLIDHVGEVRESLPRALCWTSAWDMTRDAEMRAADYLALVLAGIAQEGEIGTVQSLLRLARQSIDPFGDPSQRLDRTERLAAKCRELLEGAAAGSDMQLAFARAFAVNAVTKEQLDFLAGLLSGDRVVPGLAVDTELRWALLHRLVVTGRASDREIDAEFDRDRTAAGKRHALTLRAARPTAEAKEEAWELAVHDESLPNAEQDAVIMGFQQPEHRALLKPFEDRYFECVAAAWDKRTSEMAQQIAVGLFPVFGDESTVERTDHYLREAQPVPALRRLITEGRDNLARTLRGQARDRT
jgi:aminopeptidase N